MALRQIGEETLTVDNTTAIGFTAAEYISSGVQTAILVKCKVETESCRVNARSAQAPTTGGAEGSPEVNIGGEFEVVGADDIKNFKAISTSATSTVIRCQFFGAL